ncbi:MAG: ATP-binding protein [Chlorobi bacterium]|nr:ATP-binding protein [Chlorobiota bacterium]
MSNSNYILNIFNKNKEEITLEDIKSFFSTPQEETSVLEFKSGNVEIIDLYKEITAFLNTEGGLLIIGSPRERREKLNRNEITICEGDLTYSKFKNKDWIYQKIASNITPTPTDLSIVEFITEKGGIFLIDVPQSSIPPHQSSADGKYYIRLEREAKPAPHGIIQALFNKRRRPKLVAKININRIDDYWDNIEVSVQNTAPIPADKVNFIIDVWNVNKVESDHSFEAFTDALGDKISLSTQASGVLVRVVSVTIKFKVQHNFGEDYCVQVSYWCKDLDYDFNFNSYSPITQQLTGEGSFHKGTLLTDELDRVFKRKET